MKRNLTLILLKTINEEGNVKRLKHNGLSYREIVELIDENITKGNLIDIDSTISLTLKGRKYLSNNKRFLKETNKSKWIQLDLKNKFKPIDKDDIFLPSKKELSFLK